MYGMDYIGIAVCIVCGLAVLTIGLGCITGNWTAFDKTQDFILRVLQKITNVTVNFQIKK
jgi:hypothetical protein